MTSSAFERISGCICSSQSQKQVVQNIYVVEPSTLQDAVVSTPLYVPTTPSRVACFNQKLQSWAGRIRRGSRTNNTANARRLTLIYWTKIQKIQQCDSRNILKLAEFTEHSSMIRNELKDLMTSDDYLVTKSCPALFQVFLVECGKATYSRSLPTTGYLAVKCLYQPANAVRCSSVNCLRVKSSLFAFGPVEIDQHTQNLKIWQCSHQKPVCKIIINYIKRKHSPHKFKLLIKKTMISHQSNQRSCIFRFQGKYC